MKERNFKRCGAKTRKPGNPPCKNWPMKNKRRCRMHGGKSTGAPKGNSNAFQHGAYSRIVREADQALYDEIEVGTLDQEIRIIKLQLVRALKMQKEAEDLEAITIEDIEHMVDGRKWESLMTLITRLSGRVAKLEAARADLLTRLTHKKRIWQGQASLTGVKMKKVKHKKENNHG